MRFCEGRMYVLLFHVALGAFSWVVVSPLAAALVFYLTGFVWPVYRPHPAGKAPSGFLLSVLQQSLPMAVLLAGLLFLATPQHSGLQAYPSFDQNLIGADAADKFSVFLISEIGTAIVLSILVGWTTAP